MRGSLLLHLTYPSHQLMDPVRPQQSIQESSATARKPNDAAAVLFGLKFADNTHYKFNSSQASKARLQSSKPRAQNRI